MSAALARANDLNVGVLVEPQARPIATRYDRAVDRDGDEP
jgi:hypothetical protein